MAAAKRKPKGKLRIGNDWNAITIIALAQSNPLKAVAEFVENSIDAGARQIQIIRGKERGETYLEIHDDGEGVRKDDDGIPDFRYVATHICDSFKRQLHAGGVAGVQGEYGIGLLSFWTLGETLELTSSGTDQRNYQMRMARNNPNYEVERLRTLLPVTGTQLKVKPLLPGIRQFSGEKLDWYLASELRDRIRSSHVKITVIDRQARKKFDVTPREFDGDLVKVPAIAHANGDIYLELYLTDSAGGRVALSRRGTRVLDDLASLDEFDDGVWNSGHVEGIVDTPFLALTPGTRSGVIRDAAYQSWVDAMTPVTAYLTQALAQRRQAEEEQASKKLLQSIQRAFREAMMALPPEEYDWFDIKRDVQSSRPGSSALTRPTGDVDEAELDLVEFDPDKAKGTGQRDFFDFPGPLHTVRISPASAVLMVGKTRALHAVARDKSRRIVTADLTFRWQVDPSTGVLDTTAGEIVQFTAPPEPMLVNVSVEAVQGDRSAAHQAMITVTDEWLPQPSKRSTQRDGHGLPGYTFEHAPGSLWRSRYDNETSLIVVNNGHRDFVYASKTQALKLRYIGRLYAKELVRKNFPGASAEDMLERMIEITLYMEDNLR